MNKLIISFLLISLAAIPSCADRPKEALHPEWGRFFESRDWQGTFVLRNLETDAVDCYNPERADSGFLPASTFKITNSLISLQTGAIRPDTLFVWDSIPRRMAIWDRDMTLQEAFQASCVPVFQGIARQVGVERMQLWCDSLHYGTMFVADSLDNFWLEGRSHISPREQTEFVARLARRELPLRPEVMEKVTDIMLLEEQPTYRIYGKTGTSWEGYCWLVGWVETDNGRWSFALNFDPPKGDDAPDGIARRALVKEILRESGILPAGSES